MRVLLSEGSGLTSRQVATRLGALGHHVEVLSSTPFCLTRFTRHVRALHRVPRFADDPMAWFAAANRIARLRAIDVLLPTQEQVAVLSAQRSRLEVATVVPDFAALRRQDRHLLLRRQQHVDGAQPGDAVCRRKPGHRIVGEAGHPMQRADMTCETGEAERRRGQNFNVVTKRAQPCRDLAGGQTGAFAEEHAHEIISGYLGFARAQE